MKPLSWQVLLFLFLPLDAALNAQSYAGLNVDNYGGVHALLLNPANAADARVGFELNLASGSGFVGNDYVAARLGSNPTEWADVDWDDDLVRTPADDNVLYTNVDVLGPSIMFRTGPKSGFALVTRARMAYTVNNISGPLYEGLLNEFGPVGDFSADMRGHSSTLHAWGEAALVYGRVLMAGEHHQLRAGVSLKYLQGLGTVYTYSDGFAATYDDGRSLLSPNGDYTFGKTPGFDYEDLQPDNRTGGFGFDFGLAYEWRPNELKEGKLLQPYRLKLGASLLDFGSISYGNSEATDYTLGGTVWAGDLEGERLEDVLGDHFDGTSRREAANIRLPASAHFLLDYRLFGKLYVSALASTSLRKSDERLANRIPTTLTLGPRLETKWLSLYAPLTVGGETGTRLGAGLRFKWITVGSGSLLSSLVSDATSAADVYAGVKLPFYRRTRMKKEKERALD